MRWLFSGGVTSMDDFLKEFFPTVYEKKHAHLHETDYCKYDNQILTLFTSSLYFAALFTTFGASYVTRTRGRRASILVGSTSFFIGALVNAFAKNIAMLIIGRCFLGAGIGFGNQVSTKSKPKRKRKSHIILLRAFLMKNGAGCSLVSFRNGSGENPRSN